MDFKPVLSDWNKGIIFGLPVEKCPYFLCHYGDFLDDSYFQYYLLYLASEGRYSKAVQGLSSLQLREELSKLLKG